jgi:coenzyme F420-reducing hydrogenase delta subunit
MEGRIVRLNEEMMELDEILDRLSLKQMRMTMSDNIEGVEKLVAKMNRLEKRIDEIALEIKTLRAPRLSGE